MRVSDILGVWKLFMTRLFIPGYIPPFVWNYRPCPRTQLIVGMVLGNCLAPNWRPAIIWTNADPFPRSSTLAHICGTRGKWVNSPTLQNQCALSHLLRNHWSLRERYTDTGHQVVSQIALRQNILIFELHVYAGLNTNWWHMLWYTARI